MCAFSAAGVLAAAAGESSSPPIVDATRHRGVIHVPLGKAMELKTQRDIVRAAIGSEEIADILLPPAEHPRLVRLVGKKTGATNLILWFADGSRSQDEVGVEYTVTVDRGYTVEVITGTVTDEQLSLEGW
jgi:Flp pilus assembly secretin CpaC